MTPPTTVESQGPMIPESQNPDRDYPQMVRDRGLVEPAPRRVRGYFDEALVFDTTRAQYVWEMPYYRSITFRCLTSVWIICRTRTTSGSFSSVPRGSIR